MNNFPRPRPLVIVILDGWGISFVKEGNAIANAPTPNIDVFTRYFPGAAIQAAGIEVGLPWGEVGNSETGHRNIGAGQVQYQSLPMIDKKISDQSFFSNKVILSAINHAKQYESQLHLMGLVSPGGVHSHMNHLFALLELCAKQDFREKVFIHMFTDGRDTPPKSALAYLQSLEQAIGKYGVGKIASITGRFYAMDRNNNWDRTAATYSMMTGGKRMSGAPNPREAIEQAYAVDVLDEMIPPTAITRGGEPIGSIKNNDAIIFFNFRPDRARQLTQAFAQPQGVDFEVKPLENVKFVTLTKYDPTIPAPAAYEDEKLEFPLARVIADEGLSQMHIAETEKYAHITYYLNVGNEEPYMNEEHVLIKSSNVKNFADEPHMAAGEITDRLLRELERNLYDVYFVNFANADMVGHTGNYEATLEACAFVDVCLGRIRDAIFASGGQLLITADHGNAEETISLSSGERSTDHSTNPVPLYLVEKRLQRSTPKSDAEVIEIFSSPIGVLADIAPTVLDILHIDPPPSMTGVSLLDSLR